MSAMDPYLHHLLFERLLADGQLEDVHRDLVLAACEGAEALEAALAGTGDPSTVEVVERELPVEPPGAYLRSISVTGFRGVGPSAELALKPGPGLTLVVGRNGSGKSSFAEGLELLMTGANQRWQKRTKIWRESWQNLHFGGDTTLRAELHMDGRPGTVVLERAWASGSEATASTPLTVGGNLESIGDLGWDVALSRYRPFLSYNELGSMFDQLPTMYDALAAILGLDDVDAASGLLREARLQRERAFKAFRKRRDELKDALGGSDDDRARIAERGLFARKPDLHEVELALTGHQERSDHSTEIDTLNRLARLDAGDEVIVDAALAAVEVSQQELSSLAGTDVASDAAVASLLEQALRHHHDRPVERCPVCGTDGALDAAWRARATEEARSLRERTAIYDAAVGAVATAERRLASAAPRLDAAGISSGAADLGIDASMLTSAWEQWSADLDRRPIDAQALRKSLTPLQAAIAAVAATAGAELARREDAWRPIAAQLQAWLPEARTALAGQEQAALIKVAETWMKDAAADLQTERLAPISEAAKRNWAQLRQESNVSLEGFHLRRSGTSRSAEVDVHVDGAQSSAFGVMSQGELHALAVSVFLPRAGFSESPFRFMVIDDPVQSMDPSKVDGLARVLAEAARDRQVVVFTHDERLPQAARDLGLEATVLEVTRRPRSVVQVRTALDPIERYVEDARALIASEGVPASVVTRVVPGLCRHALEAGATETTRRRRLAAGMSHAEIEEVLDRSQKLLTRLALALFDDEQRAGDVLTRLNNRYGRWAGDAVQRANRGVHEDAPGEVRGLVRDSAKLARELAELP